MDQLPSPLLSPSKAAQAASLNQIWSEINAFLTPLFDPNPIPPFEHNPATLAALLSLSTHSVALTERHALLASTRAQALQSLNNSSLANDPTVPILANLASSLTPAGNTALATLAELSTALGSLTTSPSEMALQLVNLSCSESDIAQQLARVEMLHQQLKSEHALAQELLDKLRGESFQTPARLAEKTADWNRGGKQIGLKLGEYRDRSSRLEKKERGGGAGKAKCMGLGELKVEERELRDLEARVRGLEGRVRGFEGLPPDKEMALLEVERMRRELEGLVRKRDGMFEGLIEGE